MMLCTALVTRMAFVAELTRRLVRERRTRAAQCCKRCNKSEQGVEPQLHAYLPHRLSPSPTVDPSGNAIKIRRRRGAVQQVLLRSQVPPARLKVPYTPAPTWPRSK